MKRNVGTVARGIRTPIIRRDDDLVKITVDSVLEASKSEGYAIRDHDIICITESLLARSQGNFASLDAIAKDFKQRFKGASSVGLVFPILSRNRFAILLEAFSRAEIPLHVLLSYPNDEQGNQLFNPKLLFEQPNINPYRDILSYDDFKQYFDHDAKHPFTGVNYIDLYSEISPNITIHLSNDPCTILEFAEDVLVCSVHNRREIQQQIQDAGAYQVLLLDNLLTESVDGSGYNAEFGLLGTNLADRESVKLFPHSGQPIVEAIQAEMKAQTGKHVEVMIYGDGAFKDPVGKIWELADPVVAPFYTEGLSGQPNEIKMKYIADQALTDNNDADEVEQLLKERIAQQENDVDAMERIGTTPRQITDLVGSLADLVSGSGDKGTPVVHIQGYFDNFASQ